jgi:hypothetical protein
VLKRHVGEGGYLPLSWMFVGMAKQLDPCRYQAVPQYSVVDLQSTHPRLLGHRFGDFAEVVPIVDRIFYPVGADVDRGTKMASVERKVTVVLL